MLNEVEEHLKNNQNASTALGESDVDFVPKYDIEEIYDRIDRLNYSWQTGKIRKVVFASWLKSCIIRIIFSDTVSLINKITRRHSP